MAWSFGSDSEGLYAQCKGSDYKRYKANGSSSSDMAQGAYYSWDNGNSQRGRCTFSDLPSFDLTKYKITKFRIYFTYSGGKNEKKSMSFYLAGTADSNYKITVEKTNGAAYNDAQRSTTYTAETDINKLIASIQAGNKYLTAYNGETKKNATSGYSTNYCKMTSGYFRIYYEEVPKTPFNYYNGTSWIKPKDVKYYNGSAWVSVASTKYYFGGPSLETDSWETISAIAAAGNASKVYSIGDIKYLDSINYNGVGYLGVGVRIVDFQDYYVSAGETRHGITFEFVNSITLAGATYWRHFLTPSASGLHEILQTFKASLPYDLQSVLRPHFYQQLVITPTDFNASSTSAIGYPPAVALEHQSTISTSGLFIPSFMNYGNTTFPLEQSDNQWAYYTNGGSMNKICLQNDTDSTYHLRNIGDTDADDLFFFTQQYSPFYSKLICDTGAAVNYVNTSETVAIAFHV